MCAKHTDRRAAARTAATAPFVPAGSRPAGAATGLAIAGGLPLQWRPQSKKAADMARIRELWIHPVKSCRGIPLGSVRLGQRGFEWDRHWMVIDADGRFLSQRTHPKLATVEPTLEPAALVLRAAGRGALRLPLDAGEGPQLEVAVWQDRCRARDEGGAAADWLSALLGEAVRLVRVGAATERHASAEYAGPTPAPVGFADGFPILVTNAASLEDLNAKLPQAIPMRRFRPNLVLEGLTAFAEDGIDRLRIGQVVLRLVKPCTRCVITSTDQESGERSTDPLPVLRDYRFDKKLRGITFGENAVIETGIGASIARGDEVEVV